MTPSPNDVPQMAFSVTRHLLQAVFARRQKTPIGFGRQCLHDPPLIRQATIDEVEIAARVRNSLLAMEGLHFGSWLMISRCAYLRARMPATPIAGKPARTPF